MPAREDPTDNSKHPEDNSMHPADKSRHQTPNSSKYDEIILEKLLLGGQLQWPNKDIHPSREGNVECGQAGI